MRRPRRLRTSALPDGGFELMFGPGWNGDWRRRCPRCRDRARAQEVPEFVHDCSTSATWNAGFHDDDTPCCSLYARPEDREASWVEHGDWLLADRRRLGPDARPLWGLVVYGKP